MPRRRRKHRGRLALSNINSSSVALSVAAGRGAAFWTMRRAAGSVAGRSLSNNDPSSRRRRCRLLRRVAGSVAVRSSGPSSLRRRGISVAARGVVRRRRVSEALAPRPSVRPYRPYSR